MPKTQGSRNYSLDEQRHLLTTIAERLLLSKSDWIAVASIYNTTKDESWKDRTAASLKRKFTGIYAAAKQHSTSSVAEQGGQSGLGQMALEQKRSMNCRARHPHNADARGPTRRLPPPAADQPRSGDHHRPEHAAPTTSAVQMEPAVQDDTPVDAESPVATFSLRVTAANDGVSLTGEQGHTHCDVVQLFLWFQRRDEQ
ncbi:hypothetical protein F443_13936 [Phytophthora nicotianae P1569]|uniref:DUF6818 domain-containing protein n=1 Tax=Phytophthora nicotianae P1569 TaxID=1317065 RepID=V9EPE0_PHYNI|nr:hypothetical protein F443_13936 [Phytophthora nicotianae P1569]